MSVAAGPVAATAPPLRRPRERLQAADGAAHHGVPTVDAEVIRQSFLRPNHVVDADDLRAVEVGPLTARPYDAPVEHTGHAHVL